MSNSKRKLIIDTDTASDDAVALIMALKHKDVSIEGITIVSGNVSLQQASANARYTLELCDKKIPVFEGCAQPLQRKPAHAHWFHGEDGMSNMNYPEPKQPAQEQHALDYLIKTFANNPQAIELVTLGPLTNIAKAIQQSPDFASQVRHCFIMGGAANCVGNVTPAAEYNIWCDPEAAEIVFSSGMAITMIGWENSCGNAALTDADIAKIKSFDSPLGQFAIDCNLTAYKIGKSVQNGQGLLLADPVAMAVALDASICTQRSKHSVVISTSAETRGMTIVDQLDISPGKSFNDNFWQQEHAKVNVCWEIVASKFKELLFTSLATSPTITQV